MNSEPLQPPTFAASDMMTMDQPKPNFTGGHTMSPQDPDNPFNWPLYRRVYACLASTAFGFTMYVPLFDDRNRISSSFWASAFGITCYTAGLNSVMEEFNVSMTVAILGFSLNLLGIAFAPIMTPHFTERLGRSTVYLISIPTFALFILGASQSKTFVSLAVCRFFAGLFGGPCLVLIEGTFADCWRGHTTVSYYSILSLASYIGAACGPLIGGFVVTAKNWRWTQYLTLVFALASLLLGIGLPETYNRTILRRRASRNKLPPPKLLSAQSGVTFSAMARVTVLTPLKMLFTDPIVLLITITLAFNFAVLFQFFIAVPAVLHLVYSFTLQRAGLAFCSAIAGSLLAAATSIAADKVIIQNRANRNKSPNKDGDEMMMMMETLEYRLVPGMFGAVLMTTSLFWIGWTADPMMSYFIPVAGTAVYVWGSMMVLIACISYLFDAYPPAGTLSALTIAASLRILFAAWLPLVIIRMITNLSGAWAYSTFGFISIPLLIVPFILFHFGARLRAKSSHGHARTMMGDSGGMMMMPMKADDASGKMGA